MAAVAQFNRRDFFGCHETLELLWLREKAPIRSLYQGILQVGVAYFHHSRGNFNGATRVMERGLNHLDGFPEVCMRLDIAALRATSNTCLLEWKRLGPKRFSLFSARKIPTIQFLPAFQD